MNLSGDVMELQSPAPIKRDCIAPASTPESRSPFLPVEIKWNYCPTTLLCDLLIRQVREASRYRLNVLSARTGCIHPSEKNWQLLVYLNENWKREKKLNCVHWDFWRFWLAWSGNVLKFSFKLRPAVCQNLIDIFHVLRNIQFNSDIK